MKGREKKKKKKKKIFFALPESYYLKTFIIGSNVRTAV